MENRHALVVDCRVTLADGYGERDAAQEMAADCAGAHQKTIGADKNYNPKGFVAEMRNVGYAKSINAGRSIEMVFCWIKPFGGLRQFKLRGQENVSAVHSFGEAFGYGLHVITYNLVWLGNLPLAQPSPKE